MHYTIDMTGRTALLLAEEPATKFGTEEVLTNDEGKPLARYSVAIITAGERPDTITITAPSGSAARAGQPVRLRGLVARFWQKDGKSGMSHRADGIEPLA